MFHFNSLGSFFYNSLILNEDIKSCFSVKTFFKHFFQISTHLVDPLIAAKKLSAGAEPSNGTPDSGFRSQDNLNEVESKSRKNNKTSETSIKSLKNTIYNTLCDTSDDTDSR